MSTARADHLPTRSRLLQAAYAEIHHKGFRATSIHDILVKTGLTKGALYHHFPNKRSLGYAVVDELIRPAIMQRWVQPLRQAADPVGCLLELLQGAVDRMTPEEVYLGCALNNLAQEMSPIDTGFRLRLNRVFGDWRKGLADALRKGQGQGSVRAGIDPVSTADFIVAAIEGCVGLAKNAQDPGLLQSCGASFRQFLFGLRTNAE